jgi:hypothetical protein
VLTPSRAVVRAREAERPKTGYGVWAVDHSLREETSRIGLWLDASEHTPAQTVSAILDDLPAADVGNG